MSSINNTPPPNSNYGDNSPNVQMEKDLSDFKNLLLQFKKDLENGVPVPLDLLEGLSALKDSITELEGNSGVSAALKATANSAMTDYQTLMHIQVARGPACNQMGNDLADLLKELNGLLAYAKGIKVPTNVENEIAELQKLIGELKAGKDVSGQIAQTLQDLGRDLETFTNNNSSPTDQKFNDFVDQIYADLKKANSDFSKIPTGNPLDVLQKILDDLKDIK